MESINHPAHYGGDTAYEAIKVIEAWGLCFHTGNAVKYIARAGKKDPSREVEDLRKAIWYLEQKVSALERGGGKLESADPDLNMTENRTGWDGGYPPLPKPIPPPPRPPPLPPINRG